jgi:hypothetical protein
LTQQLNSDKQDKHPIPFQVTETVMLTMRVKETNEDAKEEKMGMERVESNVSDV